MKASERRLLLLFLLLIVVLGGALGAQQLRAWQHRLERRERDVQLNQMEAVALLAEVPMWKAKGAWLAQALPVAGSELEANQGLLESLTTTAESAGLKITNQQIEDVVSTNYYRQYGVTLGVKGQLPALMRWIYEKLDPGTFYVVPSLRITPDKDDPKLVMAQVRFLRWYSAAPPAEASQTSADVPVEPAPASPQ